MIGKEVIFNLMLLVISFLFIYTLVINKLNKEEKFDMPISLNDNLAFALSATFLALSALLIILDKLGVINVYRFMEVFIFICILINFVLIIKRDKEEDGGINS